MSHGYRLKPRITLERTLAGLVGLAFTLVSILFLAWCLL